MSWFSLRLPNPLERPMSEPYRLYWSERTAAIIVDGCLAEIGAEMERIRVKRTDDRVDDPEFEAISPMKQIPALVLPGGQVLCESLAIALALADRHPDAGLLPPAGSDARGEAYRWLLHIICNIYEADLRDSYPERYTTDAGGLVGVQKAAQSRMDWAFQVLEQALPDNADNFLPTGFSLLDLYLAVTAAWHFDTPALLARSPRIARVCRAVVNRPALKPLFALYKMPELDGL